MRSNHAWSLAAIVACAITFVMAPMVPRLSSDAAVGVLAIEQHLAGRPAGTLAELSSLTVADPDNISIDLVRPVTFWPPGQQLALYGLRRAGLPLGHAVRFVVLVSWLAGLVGWGLLFRVALPRAPHIAAWAFVALVLFRLSHSNSFVYLGGETPLWGMYPWVVLATVWAFSLRGHRQLAATFATGAAAASLLLWKYSAVFLVAGLAAPWLWSALKRELGVAPILSWFAGAATGAVPLLWALGWRFGNTPATAACGMPKIDAVIWSAGGVLMGLSDLGEAASSFARLTSPSLFGPRTVAFLTLFAMFVFATWVVLSRATALHRGHTSAAPPALVRLVVSTVVLTSAGILVLTFRGGCISYEGRHFQYAAALFLPFLLNALVTGTTSTAGRVSAIANIALFVVFPATYGAVALIDKAYVRTPQLLTGVAASGLRFDWASGEGGMAALERDVLDQPWFENALLATDAADIAVAAPRQRVLLLDNATTATPATLRGKPAGEVVLLVMKSSDGHAALRSAFADIRDWTPVLLPGVPAIEAWRGR